MKAITLWQPWASLLASGAKQYETRSWATWYRGPIAIHAASKSIKSILRECFPLGEWSYAPDYEAKRNFLNTVGNALSMQLDELPLGAVIATADLVGCHKMTEQFIASQTEQEQLFGDWTPGRYAWELRNVRQVKPVAVPGKQGLWDLRIQALEYTYFADLK